MAAQAMSKNVINPAPKRVITNQRLTAVGDVSDWVLCQGDIAIQVTGTATAVSFIVERSTRNPSDTPNPAPVATDPVTGNPSTGVNVLSYVEPGVAYWRVRITAMTGSNVDVSFATSGE